MNLVLVVGPPLSGASAVAAALGQRLNNCHVTEVASGPPDVVVFVVSAAAPMAHSDARLLDGAAAQTDAVVAVVAKIDVHRTWSGVLAANRAALARHSARYRTTPWVGVAVHPQIGPPVIGPLLDLVSAALTDSGHAERNRIRAARGRAEQQAYAARRRAQRAALRADVRRTRLELGAQARACSVTLRADLQQRVAVASRREMASFDEQVLRGVLRTADQFEAMVEARFAQVCRDRRLPVPDIIPPPRLWDGLPSAHRPAPDRVAVVFAGTFGLGVSLTLTRFLTDVGGAPVWGWAVSCAAGLALAVWVNRTRRLAAARLAADRWIAEVSAGLRGALEDRVLAVESSLLAAIAADVETPN